MPQEIQQLERELQRNQAQADAAREAERRIQQAQDMPQYQQLGDGSYQRSFNDRQGRDMTLRVEGDDAQTSARIAAEQGPESRQMIRVRTADTTEAGSPPAFKGKGEVGLANTTLEIHRDMNGQETDRRLRLNDIKVNDTHEGKGMGSQMLNEAERIGQDHGAREIYGAFSPEAGKEAATRRWYQERGWEFRPLQGGGEEVYKTLNKPDTDADAVRRELRR